MAISFFLPKILTRTFIDLKASLIYRIERQFAPAAEFRNSAQIMALIVPADVNYVKISLTAR
jgi:hypothetical protein